MIIAFYKLWTYCFVFPDLSIKINIFLSRQSVNPIPQEGGRGFRLIFFKTCNNNFFQYIMSDIIVLQFKLLSNDHFGTLWGFGKPSAVELQPAEV